MQLEETEGREMELRTVQMHQQIPEMVATELTVATVPATPEGMAVPELCSSLIQILNRIDCCKNIQP